MSNIFNKLGLDPATGIRLLSRGGAMAELEQNFNRMLASTTSEPDKSSFRLALAVSKLVSDAVDEAHGRGDGYDELLETVGNALAMGLVPCLGPSGDENILAGLRHNAKVRWKEFPGAAEKIDKQSGPELAASILVTLLIGNVTEQVRAIVTGEIQPFLVTPEQGADGK